MSVIKISQEQFQQLIDALADQSESFAGAKKVKMALEGHKYDT